MRPEKERVNIYTTRFDKMRDNRLDRTAEGGNTMDNYIRWLHLSDLHIGHKDNLWLNSTLQIRLEQILKQEGSFHFILITGDLIHQGHYEDSGLREQAKQLVTLLKHHCEHIVYSIGNHDYIRNLPRQEMLTAWQKLDIDQKRKQESAYGTKLRADFDAFVKFCKDITGSPLSTQTYLYNEIPGINIVVFNTSVFSGQPQLDRDGRIVYDENGNPRIQDTGKLWISQEALPDIRDLREDQPTIVVGHHTLSMLEDESRNRFLQFMHTVQSSYYFCGHIHAEDSRVFDGVHQLASAGVFADSYNRPTVTIHQMQKNANEHIKSKTYSFQEGEWKEDGPVVSDGVEEETESGDTREPMQLRERFEVQRSSVSDGAIRLPYHDGTFSLYLSRPGATDMLSPHLHANLDEVTYVTEGAVYAYLDGECEKVRADSAVLMPRGKLHGFLPAEYPCKFVTMGVESGGHARYESSWSDDILQLRDLDQTLSQDIPDDQRGHLLDKILSYLKSAVMEVRWAALDILKKYLAQDSDDSNYIGPSIQRLVISALRSVDAGEKLFGLNMACEFRVKVSPKTIHALMTDTEQYILPWNCTYYLIAVRTKIDYDNLFSKIDSLDGRDQRCRYYEQILVSLLQLMIRHKGSHFLEVYEQSVPDTLEGKVIPREDIVIHFVLWYTAFNFKDERINYRQARSAFQELLGDRGEEVLRGLLNLGDYHERFRALRLCRENGVLAGVVQAFFESIEEEQRQEQGEKAMSENIKEYLRIIVSERCNLCCPYCHHEGRVESLVGGGLKSNPYFDLRGLLEKARQCGFRKIKISGGEPLLLPDVLKICNEFQDAFEDIGFTTNGTQILALQDDFDKIKGSRLSFNITLNTLDENKYRHITGTGNLKNVQKGIDYLVKNGFKVKINAVITSYNVEDIESLVAYAARKRINIKLLDLFCFDQLPEEFQHISIAEIKSKLMELYDVTDRDFLVKGDYMCMETMGIQVMIPKRLYSSDCQFNCKMYPCAEGLFGIRVYEDYTCVYCFNGRIFSGNLEDFPENIEQIRAHLDLMKFTY